MKQLTYEDLKTVIDEMPKTNTYINEHLMDEFSSQQPWIYSFVNNRLIFNEDERFILLCTSEMGWHFIRRLLKRNRKVSAGFIYELYCRNIERFNESDYRKEGVLEEIVKIISLYGSQQPLMNYLLQLLKQGLTEPGSSVRIEKFPIMMLYIKAVVDCLVLDEKKEMAEIRDEKYSEEGFMSVQKSLMEYTAGFMESREFSKLTEQEQDMAAHVITTFGETMYEVYFMRPENWNVWRSAEIVKAILPEAVSADEEEFFLVMESVLMSFMDFCCDMGYISEGKAISKRLRFLQ